MIQHTLYYSPLARVLGCRQSDFISAFCAKRTMEGLKNTIYPADPCTHAQTSIRLMVIFQLNLLLCWLVMLHAVDSTVGVTVANYLPLVYL